MSSLSYADEIARKINIHPSKRAIRRAALALAISLGALAAADVGYGYLTTGRYLETTDDAYVKADSTIVAPKVSGTIAQVLVGDNEKVVAGQVLARIDDRDFRTALDQARADVAAAEAAIRNLDAQIALQQPVIAQSTADVAAAEANLKFAQEEQARYEDLMKTGSGTVQRAQQTDAALRERTAQVQHGKSGLLAAERKVDVLTTERAKAVAQLQRARAVEAQAALNLSYTTITAPVTGTVGARSLRVGQFVQGGTQLMAVVPLDAVYVVANFKETQLTHVRSGQPVELSIDSFHGVQTEGPCRQPVAGVGPRIRAAATGQRDRQFHQDRAAGSGEDRARRSEPQGPAAPGHVGRADRQHQGDRDRRTRGREPPCRERRHSALGRRLQHLQVRLDIAFAPSRIIELGDLIHSPQSLRRRP